MSELTLFPHQKQVLEETKDLNRVAYYLDMGLGKTFVGAEKAMRLNERITLVISPKSLIETWVNHFVQYYEREEDLMIYDLSEWNKEDWESAKNDPTFENDSNVASKYVLVVNYDLLFRRDLFKELEDFTLMLDESSVIQNKSSKRTKSVLKMRAKNVILLSGTPTSGKYENLWTQAHLMGWRISEDLYNKQYVNWRTIDNGGGFFRKIPDDDNPYKNVDRLKYKLGQHGAVFMKTDEVIDLPEQTFSEIKVNNTRNYHTFAADEYLKLSDDFELIGDTILTKRLYLRQLASQYNKNKMDAYKDLLQSTHDRLVVFYNFTVELEKLKAVTDRPISIINGETKDLENYELYDDSVTFVQYQAGAMGLNLQKANKIIYFSLTEKSELFEQSKKRIHRIGQERPCFYYVLMTKGSIDEDVYRNLKMRKDYTDELFTEYERMY